MMKETNTYGFVKIIIFRIIHDPRTFPFLKSNTQPKNPDGSYENPQVLELGIGGAIREGSNFESQHRHIFLVPRIQHTTKKTDGSFVNP